MCTCVCMGAGMPVHVQALCVRVCALVFAPMCLCVRVLGYTLSPAFRTSARGSSRRTSGR